MKNKDSALFDRLLSLKKEGYTYLTSLSNDNYTDYTQAVDDAYEMGGNEPSYGDWVKESLQDYKIDKYVTFHNGLLVTGESSTRYYDTEIFDIEYDPKQVMFMHLMHFYAEPPLPAEIEDLNLTDTIQTDLERAVGDHTHYAELLAYAIWNLGFEKADQAINSIDEYNNLGKEIIDSNTEKLFISYRFLETESDLKTLFIKAELWADVEFVNDLLKLDVFLDLVLSFLPDSFKQNNHDFYKNLFIEDPSIFKFCPEKMRADKEVVMAAVTYDRKALQYVSEELQNDPDILAVIGE